MTKRRWILAKIHNQWKQGFSIQKHSGLWLIMWALASDSSKLNSQICPLVAVTLAWILLSHRYLVCAMG